MSNTTPVCRTITVFAFHGHRSRRFAAAFLKAIDDEKSGGGPGPSMLDCLFFAGHSGVSTDGGRTISGFNPNPQGVAVWQSMDRLKKGEAFPGIVRDDTAVFAAAPSNGLTVVSVEIILPDPQFHAFQGTLDIERKTSQYSLDSPKATGIATASLGWSAWACHC